MGFLLNRAIQKFFIDFEKWIKGQVPYDEEEKEYLLGLLAYARQINERNLSDFGESLEGAANCGYLDANQILSDIIQSKKIDKSQYGLLVSVASLRRTSLLDHTASDARRYQYQGFTRNAVHGIWQEMLDGESLPPQLREQVRTAINNPDAVGKSGDISRSYEIQLLGWAESSIRSRRHSTFALEYLEGVISAASEFIETGSDGVSREPYTSEPSSPFELARRFTIIDTHAALDAGQSEVNIGRQVLIMDVFEETWNK